MSSISMGVIPNKDSLSKIGKPTNSRDLLRNAQSLFEITHQFNKRLGDMHSRIEKGQAKIEARQKEGKSGVDAYLAEDDEDSDDSFEDA